MKKSSFIFMAALLLTPMSSRAQEMVIVKGGSSSEKGILVDQEDAGFDIFLNVYDFQIVDRARKSVKPDDISMSSVWIDSSSTSARIGINWKKGNIDLVLWGPDGHYYDPTRTSGMIKYVSNPPSEYGNPSKFYEISVPKRGVWGIGVVGKELEAEESFEYYAVVKTDISASMELEDSHIKAGEQLGVACTVKRGANPVLDATVLAWVKDPKKGYEKTELFDDGEHGDGVANDGVYGGTISKDSEGTYKIRCAVEGKAIMGDVFYRQTLEQIFKVEGNVVKEPPPPQKTTVPAREKVKNIKNIYSDNGQVVAVIPYVDGKIDGEERWVFMHSTKDISMISFTPYKDGKKEGISRAYVKVDGEKFDIQEILYENGYAVDAIQYNPKLKRKETLAETFKDNIEQAKYYQPASFMMMAIVGMKEDAIPQAKIDEILSQDWDARSPSDKTFSLQTEKIPMEGLKKLYEEEAEKIRQRDEYKTTQISGPQDEIFSIYEQIKSGADFYDFVKESGNVKRGGKKVNPNELYYNPDKKMPKVRNLLTTMEVGDISEPVKPMEFSSDWIIVKVEDKRKQTPPSFEEMEWDLRVLYRVKELEKGKE